MITEKNTNYTRKISTMIQQFEKSTTCKCIITVYPFLQLIQHTQETITRTGLDTVFDEDHAKNL